jgi:hypothetical protein
MRAPAVLAAAGAAAAAVPALILYFRVWPEIVVPAYFVGRGALLYRDVFFPHTPLLILATGLLGRLFGFSAILFRAIAGSAMAACGALLVLGTRPHRRSRAGAIAGLLAGVPLFVFWTVYLEGPTLWPEPFLAPMVLSAALALERFERRGTRGALVCGGLVLGLAILVKQTSAWIALAALLWFLLRSRRRSVGAALLLACTICVPYAAFGAAWGLAFGTLSHLRWTLMTPLSREFSRQIATGLTGGDLLEAVALVLVIPADGLLRRCLPSARRLRSPAAAMLLGAFGMTWPRWGLLHVAAASGIAALLAARAILVARTVLRQPRHRAAGPVRLASFALGGTLLTSHAAIAILSGGSLLRDRIGGPAFGWNDAATASFAEEVRARIPPGGAFLNFHRAYENLYAITGTTTPDGTYANATFWYVLGQQGVGRRLVETLSRRPGTPVLFQEPEGPDAAAVKDTDLYRFLKTRTVPVASLPDGSSWRVVR